MEDIFITEPWGTVLAFASGFLLIANVVATFIRISKARRAPDERQDARLDTLEEWRKGVDKKLANDHGHLRSIDEGNRVTQRALLALLEHGIGGNNIEQMQRAKEELQEHLINR